MEKTKGHERATALINNYIAKTATKEELIMFRKTVAERLLSMGEDILPTGMSPTGMDKYMKYKSLIEKTDNRVIGFKMSDYFTPSVFRHLVSGNKLNAVKEVKDISGLGLKESKDVVDTYSSLITVYT